MKIFKINFFLVIIFAFFLTNINAQNKKQKIINLNLKIDSLKNNIIFLEDEYKSSLNQYSLLSLKFDSIRRILFYSERTNYKFIDSLSILTKSNELDINRLQLKIDSLNISLRNSSHRFIGKLVKIDYQMGEVNVYTFKLCAEGDYYDEHKFQAWSGRKFFIENIKEGNIYEINIGYDQNEGGYLIKTLLEIKETENDCSIW